MQLVYARSLVIALLVIRIPEDPVFAFCFKQNTYKPAENRRKRWSQSYSQKSSMNNHGRNRRRRQRQRRRQK